jgi:hypothetical protein
MKVLMGCIAALGLATCATAQQAGSTYPEGSNLPQRTAGEVGTKPAAPNSGAAGPAGGVHSTKASKAKSKAKSRKGKVNPNRAPFHR